MGEALWIKGDNVEAVIAVAGGRWEQYSAHDTKKMTRW